MDRTTMCLGIPVPALIVALALSAAPAAVFACDDAQTQVITVISADDTPTPPPPAQPVRPARAPRSPHGSATPAPVAAPAEAPETPEAPAPAAPTTELELMVAPNRITPRGWFGFGFECERYTTRPATRDSAAVWKFYTRPWVYSVETGSPAARAGLQRGDVIFALDGASILSPVAGRRFGRIKPGERVRWTVMRDGGKYDLIATAGERPGRSMRVQVVDLQRELSRIRKQTDSEEMRRQLDELKRQMERDNTREEIREQREQAPSPRQRFRYAGVIGNAEVEVRGTEAPIVNTDGNEMLISIGNSVVKIRVSDASRKRKTESPK